MPIKIPNGLPARKILEEEGVVMRASGNGVVYVRDETSLSTMRMSF